MFKLTDKTKKELKSLAIVVFIIYIFSICFNIAINTEYNTAPDEIMKYDVCQYIYNNLKLPHGGDESIRSETYGFSYAFTPILAYMFSGIFMRIISLFTQNEFALVVAARLVSVICITIYAFVCVKISEKLFKGTYKWLFIAFITLLPQLIYLGSYINNDSLAIMSIAIIVYSWIRGLEKDWDWKSCIILGVGIGICALSYYNAYGYILTSIFIYIISCIIKKINIKEFFKKGILIAAIAIAIAGWWFIRNYILYDGDFLGLNTSREYGELYAIDRLKPSKRATPQHLNMTLQHMLWDRSWIKYTLISFIGCFGYMNVFLTNKIYIFYISIVSLGIIGLILSWIANLIRKKSSKKVQNANIDDIEKTKKKEKILFDIIMIINIIIPIILSLYYSYFNDFQPQGRYVMPIIIPLMYFIVNGLKYIFDKILKNEKIRNILITFITIVWSIMPLYISFSYIVNNL